MIGRCVILKFKNKNENKNKGSVTLEAAVFAPFFIMLMLVVNGFFVLFIGQQLMSHTLIQTAKSMAFDPYAIQRSAANADDQLAEMFIDIFSFTAKGHVSTTAWYEDPDDIDDYVRKRFTAYLASSEDKAEGILESVGVSGGLAGIDFSNCSVDSDGILTINIKYKQDFIFNVMNFTSIERKMSLQVKLFEYKY